MRLITLLTAVLTFSAFSAGAQEEYQFLLDRREEGRTATVQEVVTTDTIIIDSYLKKGEPIKLIGLKAPKQPEREELPERDKFGFRVEQEVSPVSSIEERALSFAKDLLEGKEIRIEYDRYKTNAEFETIAYVFLADSDTFVNAEILRQGYADLTIDPRNRKYTKELRAAYREARDEKRGLQGF